MERIAPVRVVETTATAPEFFPMKRFIPLFAAPLALAACSDPAPDPGATASPSSTAPAVSESEALAPPVAPGASETAAAIAEATFPMAMRGRWGVNPADCDPSHGADKGKMTVGPEEVRFYESVAEIGTVAKRSETALRGTFDYEGEGMAWKREASFELVDGGRTLVLTEFGEDAPQGPRRYSQCR